MNDEYWQEIDDHLETVGTLCIALIVILLMAGACAWWVLR